MLFRNQHVILFRGRSRKWLRNDRLSAVYLDLKLMLWSLLVMVVAMHNLGTLWLRLTRPPELKTIVGGRGCNRIAEIWRAASSMFQRDPKSIVAQ